MSEIGTLKCSQCGVDFYKDEGGICAQCGKAFCRDHLYEVKEDGKVIYLCVTDKGDRPGKRKRIPILAIRRFFMSNKWKNKKGTG